MRLLLIFLAFYIGFLSCFPCQDEPAHSAGKISSATLITGDTDHHAGEAGDFCSPFCSCACCATVHMQPALTVYSLPSAFLESPEKSFEYKTSFYQNNAGLIWQPPQRV